MVQKEISRFNKYVLQYSTIVSQRPMCRNSLAHQCYYASLFCYNDTMAGIQSTAGNKVSVTDS